MHGVLVNLKKASDKVPRETVVLYEGVWSDGEGLQVKLGHVLEQDDSDEVCCKSEGGGRASRIGSGPLLFAVVLDRLTGEDRQESSWLMMFADDIVFCSENREQTWRG